MKKPGKNFNTFDCINIFLMLALCFVTIYPLWYCLIGSFNEGRDAMYGGIYWWPRVFTLENYKTVFGDNSIIGAFGISVARTVLGVVLGVLVTSMASYALLAKQLLFKKTYYAMGTLTMFFSGGLIPSFFLIRRLGLYDSFWVFVLPSLFSFYFLLVFQSFFRSFSGELEESAKMDGANELFIYFNIIMPLSKPVIATISLFLGVGHWNDYFSGIIYIDNEKLRPISTYLYQVIAQSGSNRMMENIPGVNTSEVKTVTSQSVRLATMIVATAPIIAVYPWLQKYFIKGVMIGAIKG